MRAYPVPTTGSILSICMDVGQSWQSTYLSGTICRSLTRFLSFSACSRMKWRVLPTLSTHDGALGSSVRTVGWLTGHGTFLRALGCFAAAIAAATQPYRRHRHGAHAYAALGRVLGSLRGRQPDARPVPSSCKIVGCHNSSVSRELKRNLATDANYKPEEAQTLSETRRRSALKANKRNAGVIMWIKERIRHALRILDQGCH